MTYKYNFYYDESEHSRKINKDTITADNYYDNFITGVVGWKSEKANEIEKKYLASEEKYADRMTNGELKSSTIKNRQIRNGFASLSNDNVIFLRDYFDLFNNDIYIFFAVSSKIEYIVHQLFRNYQNTLMVDIDSMKYSIIKTLVVYHPMKIIEGIYTNAGEFIGMLKEFFNDRILANKENLSLKIQENQSFSQILMVLDDTNESFSIDWEYSMPFYGFKKYLDEMNISEYSLIIDREGDESKTFKAAQGIGLKNVEEKDSKEYFGIRWADMLAGVISKLMKILHSQLAYSSIEDGINKKLLSEQWFQVNDEQLELYKQLSHIVSQLNNAWYKSFAGLYSDDLIVLISFVNYMAHFNSVSEIRETDYKLHAEYANGAFCESLKEYFSRLHSKLPINPIKKTEEDFFIGDRGQKIYFDDSKQPMLKLKEGSQTYDIVAVGFSRKKRPTVTILEKGKAFCYRIPEQLFEWAFTRVSFSNAGENIFPAKVVFTKRASEYYVDIL
jgi:hypothetical protein